MKNYRYGLYMGATAMPFIVLTQAVFPSTRSDDEVGGFILAVYLCTFCYYGLAGFLAARNTRRDEAGVWTGAQTALIGMGLITATFFLVDNVFLATVSQQVDKIHAFEHSHYTSMRAYINWSLLQGAVFVLPVLGLIGGACGAVGSLLARRWPKEQGAHT
jgi:hypothetical protein